MKYRQRVLRFLCLLAAITYLDQIAISLPENLRGNLPTIEELEAELKSL